MRHLLTPLISQTIGLKTTRFTPFIRSSYLIVRNFSIDKDLDKSFDLPGPISAGKKLAIVFTCDKCTTRSAKQISEQAYKQGVVIVRCPGCQVNHLISDQLGLFQDGKWDLESELAGDEERLRKFSDENILELTAADIAGKLPQE